MNILELLGVIRKLVEYPGGNVDILGVMGILRGFGDIRGELRISQMLCHSFLQEILCIFG